jgi:hypothetical protein
MWGHGVILSLFFLYVGEERRHGRSLRGGGALVPGWSSSWWGGGCRAASAVRGDETSRVPALGAMAALGNRDRAGLAVDLVPGEAARVGADRIRRRGATATLEQAVARGWSAALLRAGGSRARAKKLAAPRLGSPPRPCRGAGRRRCGARRRAVGEKGGADGKKGGTRGGCERRVCVRAWRERSVW